MTNPIPSFIETAIAAIDTPEVQDILSRLSKYNLGVCIPHMHTESECFSELPAGMVQLEINNQVSFVSTATAVDSIPVAWRWEHDGVKAHAACVAACQVQGIDRNGNRVHISIHNHHDD